MHKIADAELIIGVVGRMGVDTKAVYQWIAETLHSLHYTSHHIKVTDFLKTKDFPCINLTEKPIEARYESYIEACNKIREISQLNEFFVSYAVESIRTIRKYHGSPDEALPRNAYVIDQIKRPEEVNALRRIYGKQFILISCHIPRDVRRAKLSSKIAVGHASAPKSKEWESVADNLIERDDKESSKPFGQRVGDVIPLGDLIINAEGKETALPLLCRFFEALFGNFAVSPTRDEFFQNIAFNSALTSCDTARQVGAVIAQNGEIVTTGFNEAPKSGGGTYWSNEGEDARDFALGRDFNTIRKRQMVADIVKRLRDGKYLSESDIPDTEIEERFIDGKNAPLKKSQIMDTLEYGRAVHAEMAALSTAARLGNQVRGAVLYCTTFLCHNCSKHIVAAGIRSVFFLEPYGKSFTEDLYPDSIDVDKKTSPGDAVQFNQFIGITPNRYAEVFSKEKLKDNKGNVLDWQKDSSQPIFEKLDQGHIDREVMFQKYVYEGIDTSEKKFLGLPVE